jgi:hypothetical protein
MGLIAMSERDLQRIEVLSKVVAGRMTLVSAAHVLDLSERQVRRLLERMRTGGAASIRHKAIGRPSNNRISDGVRDYAVTLVRECYADFGPTWRRRSLPSGMGCVCRARRCAAGCRRPDLACRASSGGRFISRGCGAKPMASWCRSTGRSIAGSRIADRSCSLLVFIDDATGRLMQLRFVRSESAFTYFEALALYLQDHGAPIAFYSDKHSVFRVAKKDAKGGQGMTQFGRALCELNIEILCANSSQAKGRVERMNRTLQDRLVKALRLAGIDNMEAGNAFLPVSWRTTMRDFRSSLPVPMICTGR